jgi:hypothetical protein
MRKCMYGRTPCGISGWPSRMKRLLKATYGLKQAHKVFLVCLAH